MLRIFLLRRWTMSSIIVVVISMAAIFFTMMLGSIFPGIGALGGWLVFLMILIPGVVTSIYFSYIIQPRPDTWKLFLWIFVPILSLLALLLVRQCLSFSYGLSVVGAAVFSALSAVLPLVIFHYLFIPINRIKLLKIALFSGIISIIIFTLFSMLSWSGIDLSSRGIGGLTMLIIAFLFWMYMLIIISELGKICAIDDGHVIVL